MSSPLRHQQFRVAFRVWEHRCKQLWIEQQIAEELAHAEPFGSFRIRNNRGETA